VSCALSHDDVLVELESADAVAAARPDFAALNRQPFRGHIITARATAGADFVSRTFFPALGVNEDQVCVTAHCKLTPFWAGRLGRTTLTALQLSERGGRLQVQEAGDRVKVLGSAVLRAGVHGELAAH
jgi:predicted PhzF superfamily epimerase YddE/YHI9